MLVSTAARKSTMEFFTTRYLFAGKLILFLVRL